jgi:cytidyltransferase-like protein
VEDLRQFHQPLLDGLLLRARTNLSLEIAMPKKKLWYWCKPHIREEDELQWIRVPAVKLSLKRPVVLVNGGFDILHSGHLKVLAIAHAKARRGTLVCAMDSDERVRAAKGPGRPIMSWIERATALQYTGVDYLVEISTDEDMARLIDAIEPTLRVQGSDYMGTKSKYPEIVKAYVARRGLSTSEIIRRCQNIRSTDERV